MEMLLSTITNTDNLIRNYKEVCNERNQLKRNLQAISESSGCISQIYQKETEKSKQLTDDNKRLNGKIVELQTEVRELRHKQLNDVTIHQQTVAELEERIGKEAGHRDGGAPLVDYIDMCKLVIAQSNLLQRNQLEPMMRPEKYKQITKMLRKRNEPVEELKQSSVKRSTKTEVKKQHATIATMTDFRASLATTPKVSSQCDKVTMHRTSTATRSTCTSVFIKKVDASTNTESEPVINNGHIRNLFDDIVPHPPLLSPIKSADLMPSQSRPPPIKTFRNQGTITQLQHVGKEIGYAKPLPFAAYHLNDRAGSSSGDSGFASPVQTKEEYSDQYSGDGYLFGVRRSNVNTGLMRSWQDVGEKLFTLAGTGRLFNDNAFLSNLGNGDLARRRAFQDEWVKYGINQLEAEFNHGAISSENEMDCFDSDFEVNGLGSSVTHAHVPERKPIVILGKESILDDRFEGACSATSVTKASSVEKRLTGEDLQAVSVPVIRIPQSSEEPTRESSAMPTKRQKKIEHLFKPPKRIKLQQKVTICNTLMKNIESK